MPSLKNKTLLEEAKSKISRAQAVYFVNYQGLTHKQLEEARVLLKDLDSELSIIKNTLVELVFKEKKIDLGEKLFGPNALFLSYKDPFQTAKILNTFFKKYNPPATSGTGGQVCPKINFGIFEGKIIDDQTIIQLASIPGREVLLGKLVGLLNSPMTKLAYGLNWNIQKLLIALQEIKNQRSKIKN